MIYNRSGGGGVDCTLVNVIVFPSPPQPVGGNTTTIIRGGSPLHSSQWEGIPPPSSKVVPLSTAASGRDKPHQLLRRWWVRITLITGIHCLHPPTVPPHTRHHLWWGGGAPPSWSSSQLSSAISMRLAQTMMHE